MSITEDLTERSMKLAKCMNSPDWRNRTMTEMQTLIEQVEELLSKATPGPWEKLKPGSVIGHRDRAVVQEKGAFDWICSMQVSNCPNWENDAQLIAQAPELLRQFVDLVKQQQEQLNILKAALEYYADDYTWIGMSHTDSGRRACSALDQINGKGESTHE
jgi:hypothetical protein